MNRILFKFFRKIHRVFFKKNIWTSEECVELRDELANNKVYELIGNALKNKEGLMVCKSKTI